MFHRYESDAWHGWKNMGWQNLNAGGFVYLDIWQYLDTHFASNFIGTLNIVIMNLLLFRCDDCLKKRDTNYKNAKKKYFLLSKYKCEYLQQFDLIVSLNQSL